MQEGADLSSYALPLLFLVGIQDPPFVRSRTDVMVCHLVGEDVLYKTAYLHIILFWSSAKQLCERCIHTSTPPVPHCTPFADPNKNTVNDCRMQSTQRAQKTPAQRSCRRSSREPFVHESRELPRRDFDDLHRTVVRTTRIGLWSNCPSRGRGEDLAARNGEAELGSSCLAYEETWTQG